MPNPDHFDIVLQSLPDDAYHRRAWLALLRCFSKIERELMQHFSQKYNSSLPRYDVLTALSLHNGGLTMGELAAHLGVSKGNITGVVRRLKADGLVRKATSPSDRRIQSVTLLPAGAEMWEAMHEDYDQLISSMLSGQPDKEVQSLTRMLERTLAAVTRVTS